MNTQTEYILDEATRGYIMETHQAMQQAVAPYQTAMQSALSLVCRQNKLEGNWTLSSDGAKLVRAPEPQADFTKVSRKKK